MSAETTAENNSSKENMAISLHESSVPPPCVHTAPEVGPGYRGKKLDLKPFLFLLGSDDHQEENKGSI